jgi:hypothetical protein
MEQISTLNNPAAGVLNIVESYLKLQYYLKHKGPDIHRLSFLMKLEINLTKATTKTKLMVGLLGIIEAGAVAIVNFGLTIGDAILIIPITSA